MDFKKALCEISWRYSFVKEKLLGEMINDPGTLARYENLISKLNITF